MVYSYSEIYQIPEDLGADLLLGSKRASLFIYITCEDLSSTSKQSIFQLDVTFTALEHQRTMSNEYFLHWSNISVMLQDCRGHMGQRRPIPRQQPVVQMSPSVQFILYFVILEKKYCYCGNNQSST